MNDEEATEDIKTVRLLKNAGLSQKDWTGIISVLVIGGYIALAGVAGITGKEFSELSQIGTAASMIVAFYIGRKTK